MSLDHLDPASAGGWLAAVGVALAWLLRAFSIVRKVSALEASVVLRLDAIEARLDRQRDEITAIRETQQRHLEAELARSRL